MTERERIAELLGDPGDDPVGWLVRAWALGVVGCIVPVTVDGDHGIAHAAFGDYGGLHDQAAHDRWPGMRVLVALHDCRNTYRHAYALGVDR